MIAMPPMPSKPRKRGGMPSMPNRGKQTAGSMPPMPSIKEDSEDINRVVEWQPADGIWNEPRHADVEGTCARCDQRVPAIELRWRPDVERKGNLLIQGSWECRQCNPEPGKWDIAKVSATNAHRRTPMGHEPDTIQIKGLIWSKSLQRWIPKKNAVILEA